MCIGSLALVTRRVKEHLKREASLWKLQYARNLHQQAKTRLEDVISYVRDTMKALKREVTGIDDLQEVMEVLHEVRSREATIDLELKPISETYMLLKHYEVNINKQEEFQVAEMHNEWEKMLKRAG